MSFLEEFRSQKIVTELLELFQKKDFVVQNSLKIMEVCGTHTRAISRAGLRGLLPTNLELISGPGCPICVTPLNYLDTAIKLGQEGVIIATFADLLRVPGSNSSLEIEQAQGSDIIAVNSPLEAVEIAHQNPNQEVLFLAIGFETTAPLIALSVIEAKKRGLKNYSLLQGIKTMPEVMKKLVVDKKVKLDGFLCPGHVASITGSEAFDFLAVEHNLPAAVAGFEAGDIVFALLQIIKLINRQQAEVINSYPRVVDERGNQQALKLMEQVFEVTVSNWRGLGIIEDSGLKLSSDYQEFAAENRFSFKAKQDIKDKNSNCSCGEILIGAKQPSDCAFFATKCTPNHPCGPCMVSQEGSCATYYLYKVGLD